MDIRDIQGRLDGAVKVMEKISNRFLLKTIKTLRRAGYEQEAKKLVKRTADERKTQNTLQVLSWTISWTFVSNQFVCDQQSAQSVCTYSSNEPLRAEYEDGVRGIMNSASKISKQAVKFVTKAFGRSSAAAKKVRKARKKTLQRIVNMGEEHIELSLTGIPQVNASCPF